MASVISNTQSFGILPYIITFLNFYYYVWMNIYMLYNLDVYVVPTLATNILIQCTCVLFSHIGSWLVNNYLGNFYVLLVFNGSLFYVNCNLAMQLF